MIRLRFDEALRPPSAPTEPWAAFQWVMALEGESIRKIERRHTFRVSLDGRQYFVKCHYGLRYRDILGEWIRLRSPVLGAENEYLAIQRLGTLGIASTPIAGFGVRGWWPTTRQSFLMTLALEDTCTLNELSRDWDTNRFPVVFKWRLIHQVAGIVGNMHRAGVNHRDLYLSHFRIPLDYLDDARGEPPISLMDLHRAQMRDRVPRRWLVKDLAALWFSSIEKPLTQRDYLRFLNAYFTGLSLRRILSEKAMLLQKVHKKAMAMERQHVRRINRQAGVSKV